MRGHPPASQALSDKVLAVLRAFRARDRGELALLPRREVEAKLSNSRSGVYAGIADGVLVPPIAQGDRTRGGGVPSRVAWINLEVDAIIEARILRLSKDEMQELVRELVAARSAILAQPEAA